MTSYDRFVKNISHDKLLPLIANLWFAIREEISLQEALMQMKVVDDDIAKFLSFSNKNNVIDPETFNDYQFHLSFALASQQVEDISDTTELAGVLCACYKRRKNRENE